MLIGKLYLLIVSCVLMLYSQQVAVAQPTLVSASFFGGPGDQYSGLGITIQNGTILIGDNGNVIRYAVPPGAPAATATLSGVSFLGLTMAGNAIYAVGAALPPAC